MYTYSFWADEAYISSIVARIINGQISLLGALELPGITYQKLHMLSIAASFKLFGVGEFAGRMPAIVAFVLGAVLIFFLTKRVGNIYAAIISTFLYIFSHLNLAYATQAKPYAAIETLTLGLMLLLYHAYKEKRMTVLVKLNLETIVLCTMATFFHFIGFLLWIFYFTYIGFSLRNLRLKRNTLLALIVPLALLVILTIQFVIPTIKALIEAKSIFSYNHFYQVVRLFGYQYFFISVFAFLGFLLTFPKNRVFGICVIVYTTTLLILASFQQYIFNIRYVLSVFGIIFLYFGVFWGEIVDRYFIKWKWLIPLIVIATLYITGYKVVRTPRAYYSPNIDKYGDIQVANYKDFYSKLKKIHPNYKNLIIFNDTLDAEDWYMHRYSNVYFQKFTLKPRKDQVTHTMIYGSLDDFKKQVKKYPRGLVIVEDWESFIPEDIKQYIKKNLKLEYRVESLKEAPNDPWPLALYSWGM